MNAPVRITVTVDRHGEPIVFGAAEGDGCSVVEYVRADRKAEAMIERDERAKWDAMTEDERWSAHWAMLVRLASVLHSLQAIGSIPSPPAPDGRPQVVAVRIAQDSIKRYGEGE